MNRWWGAGLFAGGLIIGWVVRGDGAAATTAAPDAKAERQRREPSRKPVAHEAKWQGLDERLLVQSYEERTAFSQNLSSGDRLLALEALMKSAGPEGINYELRSVMESILRDWASADFDGAWASAVQVDHPGLRQFMLSILLDTQIQKDPDKALALYLDQVSVDPNFSSRVPLSILGLRAEQGADAFIDALSRIPTGRNSMGTEMKFSADFDFRKVADAVAALKKEAPDRKPPAFATNFFEKWASRDSEEAQNWWKQNGSVDYNNWGGLLSGVEKTQGSQAAAAWAANELESDPDKRDAMIEGLEPSNEGFANRIDMIAAAMPDGTARDRFLSDVFAAARFSDPLERLSFLISGMSSPEARLDAMRNFTEKAGYHIETNVPDTRLQEWGISRQQLNESLRPTSKKGR